VPEPAALSADAVRKRAVSQDQRRREAVAALRLAEQMCGYAAGQLGNGLGPDEARAAALEAAAELAELASVLRRLTRLSPAERRRRAVQLAGLGMPKREVAIRLGVSERAVWYYLAGVRGRRADRGSGHILTAVRSGERN
jgi:DNA-binding CsgD family transcriptional regulator